MRANVKDDLNRFAKARADREARVREVFQAKATRYIRRTQPEGEQTDLLLEALGLIGEPLMERHCPHCGMPFQSSDHRCKKTACQVAARKMEQAERDRAEALAADQDLEQ